MIDNSTTKKAQGLEHCLFLLVVFLISIFSAKAAEEVCNSRIESPAIFTPSALLSVADNKFQNTVNWFVGFTNVLADDRIEFGIDENKKIFHGSYFRSTITFDYTAIDASLNVTTATAQQLSVSYNPSTGTVYTDKSVLNLSGFYKVDITITSINTVDASLSPIANPTDIYLESEIATTRYYDFNQLQIPSIAGFSYNYLSAYNELEVYWGYIPGAEEYELEWSYVNDYDGMGSNLPISALKYSFDHDATRIITPNTFYRIPLVLENGIVFFRIRGIGRGGNSFDKKLEGSWISEDPLVIAYQNATGVYPFQYNISAHTSDKINWMYTATYAEDGKRGNGVSYMDGSGLQRQTVATLNTEDKTIVQSTLYDHQGRPAIGVLPAPISNQKLDYNQNVNMFDPPPHMASEIPYDRDVFDVDQGSCNPAPPPMDDVTSVGAANYYSTSTNTSTEGMQAFVPDAQDYPFVQVEYTPDLTGRIKRQTLPGSTHQLFSGKDLQYFYSQPNQVELDRLFGSEVGFAKHYKKNSMMDANGQISVSYIDMHDRVVATALAGTPPANVDPLDGSGVSTSVSENLINFNVPNANDYSYSVDKSIFVDAANTPYTFTYSFAPEEFTDACIPVDNLCFDCVYEIELSIKDECQNEMIDVDGSGGNPPAPISVMVGNAIPYDNICNNAITFTTTPNPLIINLPNVGSYTVHKKLKVSDDPIPYYLSQYLANNTCIRTLNDFQQDAISQLDFSGCGYTCAQCVTALNTYTLQALTDPTKHQLSAQEYAAALADCQEGCQDPDPCDASKQIMIQDFFPGGQYATYIVQPAGTYYSADPLSIFNTTNSLQTGVYITWQNPPSPYLDDNGNPAQVYNNAGILVAPQNLSREEFIDKFEPSWAASFVTLHPEYCYYEFCVANSASAAYDNGMLNTSTYDAACAAGYLIPLQGLNNPPSCTQVLDPFFATGGFGETDMSTMTGLLNNYPQNSSPFTTGFTIYQLAVQSATQIDPPPHTIGSETCTKDLEWQIFRGLYLSLKYKYVEYWRTDYAIKNGCYNGCIGNQTFSSSANQFDCYPVTKSPACNFDPNKYNGYADPDQPCSNPGIYAGKQKRFPSLIDLFNFDPFNPSAVSANTLTTVAPQCSTTCNAYADAWIQRLPGCFTSSTPQSLINDIKADLVKVCMNGCDQNHPFGSSTCPTATSPNNFTTFQQVLDYYLAPNSNTADCNALLITMPEPFDHSYSSGSNTYPIADQCACNTILQNELDFASMQSAGTLPAGVTTPAELFIHNNNLSDFDIYEQLKCKCDDAFGHSPSWSSGATWNSTQLQNLQTPALYIPDGFSCKTCVGCQAVTFAYNNFITQHPGWNTNTNFPTIITNYLNSTLNMNVTYPQYLNFLSSCAPAGDRQPCTNLTQYGIDFPIFLNALASSGNFTTSFTMTPTNMPSFFSSSLYTGSATSVQYTATLANNNHVLNVSMTDGAGYSCAFSVEITIVLPQDFTNITITSFSNFSTSTSQNTTNSTFVVTANYTDANGTGTITLFGFNLCYPLCADSGPVLCSGPITPTVPIDQTDCMQSLIDQANTNAGYQYQSYITGVINDFINKYKTKCYAIQPEIFTMDYILHEYHYTLYYYDEAGNLVRTVAPNATDPNILSAPADLTTAFNSHVSSMNPRIYPPYASQSVNFRTEYQYNTFEEPRNNNTPDGGTTIYFYDGVGRIVASQNAKQAAVTPNFVYSYTRYDDIGRIIEVGEASSTSQLVSPTNTQTQSVFNTWLSTATRAQVTQTYYDILKFTIPNFTQANLRNRVASVTFEQNYDGNDLTYDYATHYTYDEHGNVDHLIQDNKGLASLQQEYKQIDYEYDLVSGNVNKVIYQKGMADQFYHKYFYDADNRLHEVYTSRDGELWDKDGKYFYMQHGPLGRTELGDKQVQGVDYAYTIQGWVKGINSNVLLSGKDIGKDRDAGTSYISTQTGIHANFPEDAASYSLRYFINDYSAVKPSYNNFIASTSLVENSGNPFNLAADAPELFNGNISAMVTSITDPTGNKMPQITAYRYDQLNRINQMKAYANIKLVGGVYFWENGNTYNGSYQTNMGYDANGNIISNLRNGVTPNLNMDDLHYMYYKSGGGTFDPSASMPSDATNKLAQVSDNISTPTTYLDDIELGQAATNYDYDQIGNLKQDLQEEIASIEWTVDRKVSKVLRTTGSTKSDLEFEYDANRNRVLKIEKPAGTDQRNWIYTYYVRDAAGNVMSTYQKTYAVQAGNHYNAQFNLQEQDLYGSSRLGARQYDQFGIANLGFTSTGFNSDGTFNNTSNFVLNLLNTPTNILDRNLGEKNFEITNHLGNVLATVLDRKDQHTTNNTTVDYYNADVSSAQDEYAFGMIEPGRNFSTNIYRYGFNGKEKDDEMKGSANSLDFEFRHYDPRLGRFMSIDPLASQYAGWTTYGYAQDRPIDGIDFEGLEYVSAANWAENNLFGWKFGSRGWYYSFNKYRQPSTVLKMNNEVYCYESVILSCAQGNGLVADYLSLEGMPLNRAEAMDWFKRGGEFHSFIDKDYSQVKRGDILFKGKKSEMEGHAAIVASPPVFSEDNKSFTLEVYSTNTDPSNEYGIKTYAFTKDNTGQWYAGEQKLSGFGRIDEKGIIAKQQQVSNNTFDVKSILQTIQTPLFKFSFEFQNNTKSQTQSAPRFTPSNQKTTTRPSED